MKQEMEEKQNFYEQQYQFVNKQILHTLFCVTSNVFSKAYFKTVERN